MGSLFRAVGSLFGMDGGSSDVAAAQRAAKDQQDRYNKQLADINEANKLAANKSMTDTVKVEVGGDATASGDLLGEVKKKRQNTTNSSSLGL